MIFITFQSPDGYFYMDKRVAQRCSGLIESYLQSKTEEEQIKVILPVPIKIAVLREFSRWAHYTQKDNEKSRRVPTYSLNLDLATLDELIQAADFLIAEELHDIACMAAANMMKGKTLEEIYLTRNIENDEVTHL